MEFVPRYIKTSGNATVDHLSKYLAVRLALEELRRNTEASPVNVEAASEKQYTIYIPTAGNQFTVGTHTRTQWSHCNVMPGVIVPVGVKDSINTVNDKVFEMTEFPYVLLCSQVLNGSFSLELVSEKYWKVNKPMELYFAPTKEHK